MKGDTRGRRAPHARGRVRFAVAVVAVLAAIGGCRRSASLVGSQAPEFSLTDLSGNAMRLANFKGRVVFLNVWTTWCEPCREEMPSMQSLYTRLRGPDFEMLGVNADQGDRAVVEQFVRDHGITFPVLPDPDLQIADRYGVTGYPETFIIDRNGRVVDHQLGPRDWDSIESHAAFRRLIERGEWSGF
jgi:peroxiredoxin